MAERKCSAILIAESDEITGIWTQRDAQKFDFSSPDARSWAIKEGMSSPAICVNENESLEEVLLKLKKDGVRHYVVIDDHGKQQGIVSQVDVDKKQGFEFFSGFKNSGQCVKACPADYPGNAEHG